MQSMVSVPSFYGLLDAEGKITLAAVTGYLKRLGTSTSASLVAEATQAVSKIAQKRGEKHDADDHH